MPRVRKDAETGQRRIMRALYHRCRHGDPEALVTLAYRVADRMYTGATYVTPDEETAFAVVQKTWEDILRLLLRLRVGGHILQRAEHLLAANLASYAEPRAIQASVHQAMNEDDDSGLLTLSARQLEQLVEMVPQYAEPIARQTARRTAFVRHAGLACGILGLGLLVYAGLIWFKPGGERPDIRIAGLQQRIQQQDLVGVMRDSLLELADPRGADSMDAAVLERALLAIEELANMPADRGNQARYVSERLREEELAARFGEILKDRQLPAGDILARAQLVLEEVEKL